MRFSDAGLPGAFLMELEPHADERGFFARAFCERELGARGLLARFPQCNLSWNRRRGTLRGLHYNAAPHAEAKIVRCTRGAVHDVIVDLRRESAARGRSVAVRLDAESRAALYVPAGFAHGFLTLVDDSEVFYHMSRFYRPDAARGLRWDDPLLAIGWPFPPEVVSERDLAYPGYDPDRFDG